MFHLQSGAAAPLDIILDSIGNIYIDSNPSGNVTLLPILPNAILMIQPSVIKVNKPYLLELNNVINAGIRVNTGTCSLRITDTITTVVLQT